MALCSRNAMEHVGDWVTSVLILHICYPWVLYREMFLSLLGGKADLTEDEVVHCGLLYL